MFVLKSIFVLGLKEFRSYFKTYTAYVYLFIFLLTVSWFFFSGFFVANQADMRAFFSLLPWVFLFLVPSVTMRLWSEEKRLSTFEMLLTLPVRDECLILGKYFSSYLFLLLSLLFTVNIPITLFYLGTPDVGPIVGGYIGAFLMGGSFLAIGIFSSCLTVSQVVAFIITVATSFFFLIIGQSVFLYNLKPEFAYYFSKFSIYSHFESLSRGLVDTRDIIYFLSLSLFFLYLNKQVLSMRGTKKKLSGELGKIFDIAKKSAVFLVILILLNVLSNSLYLRFDLTENKRYTLSQATIETVQALDKPLNIYLYFSDNLPSYMTNLKQSLIDTIMDYKSYSDKKLDLTVKDPLENKNIEAKVIKMGIPKVQVNVFEGDEASIKAVFLGMAITYGSSREVMPIIQSAHNFEYELTSKIKKLTRNKELTLAFLSGHGEWSIYSEYSRLKESLEKLYKVKDVNFQTGRTLEGVDTLIVSGPKETITEEDAFRIDQFLLRGGKAVFLMDKYRLDMGELKTIPLDLGLWISFLKHYGISIANGVVSDSMSARANFQQSSSQFSSTYPFWPKITPPGMNDNNPVTSMLSSFVLPWASPLVLKTEKKQRAIHLAKTSPFSFVKKGDRINLTPIKRFNPHLRKKLEKKDRFLLAGVLDGEFESFFKNKDVKSLMDDTGINAFLEKGRPTKIAVVSTSHFAKNEMLEQFPNNERFILNIVDWLNLDQGMISIRSRSVIERPLARLSANERFWIKEMNIFGWAFFSVVLLCLVGGVLKPLVPTLYSK